MRLGASRLHTYVLLLYCCNQAFPLLVRAAEGQKGSWPACSKSAPGLIAGSLDAAQAQQIARITLPSSPSGCSLVFASDISAEAAGVQLLAPDALIAGVFDGSVGRPPVVQLHSADSAAAAGSAPLLLPAGGRVILQDLLLSDVTLSNPKLNPSQAFLPTALQLPPGSTLQLTDVKMMISREQLQDYIVFVIQYPEITYWTDGVSFLHVRSFSSSLTKGPAAAVEGSAITLLAPSGARIDGTPVPILQSITGNDRPDAIDPAAVAAARGDEAGVLTVTDSYVLGATNATLVSLIQRVAGQQELKNPALLFIATNVTLSPAAGGPEWTPGGVKIKRPVIWVGSSWRNTSIDFHMEVGQFVLQGPTANVTLVNLVLENLAYGDEVSARDAEGKSLSRSHILWSFRFRRAQPRLVLVDDVMVLPEQIQVDNAAYWSDGFNSDLDFWKNQTAFMRGVLGISVQKYKRGKNPGEYVMDIVKKDQLMTNVTYTARPYVAPPLKLVINPTLHSDIVTYRADPGVGPVYSREDVAATLYNLRRSGCQRSYILLPTAPSGGAVDWGPTRLIFNHTDSVALGSSQGPFDSSTPQPLRASQLPMDPTAAAAANGSSSSAADSGGIARMWPSPGGEVVMCPVQFRGVSNSDQPTTTIDLGFARGLFRLQDGPSGPQPGVGPGSQAVPPPLAGQSAAPQATIRTPLLQFGSLVFRSLPQGNGFGGIPSDSSSADDAASQGSDASAPAAVAIQIVAGGVGSNLPAEAYTHLLWFISRDITGNSVISLTNVTLYIPAGESAQLQQAAHTAIAAVGSSDAAVLSMVYPTANGSLPVVYRTLWFTNGPSYASTGDYASLFVGRRRSLLQQPAAGHDDAAAAAAGAAELHSTSRVLPRRLLQFSSSLGAGAASSASQAAANGRMLCVGNIEGLGISGRNICLAAQDSSAPLPPGYIWPTSSSSAASDWAPWKAALVAISVAIVCLAATWAFIAVRRKRQQRLAAEKGGIRSGSGTDGSRDLEPSGGCRDQGSQGSGTRTSAAALAAASNLLASSSTSSNALKQLALALNNTSVGAADTTDSASSVTAATGAGSSKGKDSGSVQFVSAISKGATEASDKLKREHSVTVGLGEELGRLAAIHQSLLSPAAVDDDDGQPVGAAGVDQRGALQQQQQQQGDLQALRSASSLQQQQQQPPSTVQRLSSAITAVSAEMHMRRLSGCPPGPSPGPAGASDATAASSIAGLAAAQGCDLLSKEAVAAAAGRSLQQQQHCASSTPVPGKSESGGPPVSREGSGSSTGSQQQQQQLRQLQLHEVIGSGTFGVVYRATWQGIPAAVKVMQLPVAGVGGDHVAGGLDVCCSRREQMAVMETALGSSLSHPNIVQVYTYHLRPLGHTWSPDDCPATAAAAANGSSCASVAAEEAVAASLMRHSSVRKGSGGSSGSASVAGYELQLVMEFCPLGSLRAAIDNCLLEDRLTGRPQYLTVLSLALGVARAMHHLHTEGVLHGDLKAGNVLLKMEVVSTAAAGMWAAPFGGVNQTREVLVSKVADFGLACRISDQDTHISGVHRGTLSHMSPELLVHGRASRASDVYAMGILLWEMATGLKAFAGVPKAMLGAAVVRDRARPQWPSCSSSGAVSRQAAIRSFLGAGADSQGSGPVELMQPSAAYRELAERCWAHEPQDRPTFAEITSTLESLLQEEQQQLASIAARSHQEQQRWAVATAAAQHTPAATAPAAAATQQNSPHKAGAVEAVRKLLGPTPSSSKPPDQAATAAAAAPAGPVTAAPAAPVKRQRSVTFADVVQSPVGSAAASAAAAKAGSSSGSSNQSQVAGSPAGSGSQNYVTAGQRKSVSNSPGGLPAASTTGFLGVPASSSIRQAAVAAVAAVLQEPAAHGNGAWLTHGLSGRLYSVKEEAAEEHLADMATPATAAAAGGKENNTPAQQLRAAAHAAGAGVGINRGPDSGPDQGAAAVGDALSEISPAGASGGGSPFDALKGHAWE